MQHIKLKGTLVDVNLVRVDLIEMTHFGYAFNPKKYKGSQCTWIDLSCPDEPHNHEVYLMSQTRRPEIYCQFDRHTYSYIPLGHEPGDFVPFTCSIKVWEHIKLAVNKYNELYK